MNLILKIKNKKKTRIQVFTLCCFCCFCWWHFVNCFRLLPVSVLIKVLDDFLSYITSSYTTHSSAAALKHSTESTKTVPNGLKKKQKNYLSLVCTSLRSLNWSAVLKDDSRYHDVISFGTRPNVEAAANECTDLILLWWGLQSRPRRAGVAADFHSNQAGVTPVSTCTV